MLLLSERALVAVLSMPEMVLALSASGFLMLRFLWSKCL